MGLLEGLVEAKKLGLLYINQVLSLFTLGTWKYLTVKVVIWCKLGVDIHTLDSCLVDIHKHHQSHLYQVSNRK